MSFDSVVIHLLQRNGEKVFSDNNVTIINDAIVIFME